MIGLGLAFYFMYFVISYVEYYLINSVPKRTTHMCPASKRRSKFWSRSKDCIHVCVFGLNQSQIWSYAVERNSWTKIHDLQCFYIFNEQVNPKWGMMTGVNTKKSCKRWPITIVCREKHNDLQYDCAWWIIKCETQGFKMIAKVTP